MNIKQGPTQRNNIHNQAIIAQKIIILSNLKSKLIILYLIITASWHSTNSKRGSISFQGKLTELNTVRKSYVSTSIYDVRAHSYELYTTSLLFLHNLIKGFFIEFYPKEISTYASHQYRDTSPFKLEIHAL